MRKKYGNTTIIYPEESLKLYEENMRKLRNISGKNLTNEYVHNPQLIKLDKEEIEVFCVALGNTRYKHYIERTELNDYDQMLYLDLYSLSNQRDKENVRNGKKVVAYFFGEKWTLLPDYASMYHSVNKTGEDCFKWCSESGRELVIRQDHVLEIDPSRVGTFNYTNPDGIRLIPFIKHYYNDMYPYNIFNNYLTHEQVDYFMHSIEYSNVNTLYQIQKESTPFFPIEQ